MLRQAAMTPDPLKLSGDILKVKLSLGLLWAVGLWLVLSLLRPNIYIPILLAFVILDIWLDSCFNTLSTVLNATQRIRTVSILISVSRGLRLVGAIVLILLNVNDLYLFTIIRTASTFIIFLSAVIVTRPIFRAVKIKEQIHIWKQSLPFGFSDFLSLIYGQLDITLLALLSSSLQVGVYTPAVGLINGLITVIVSAYFFFIPHLTHQLKLHAENIRRVVFQTLGIFFLIGMVATIAIGGLGPWLVKILLQQSYEQTSQLVLIMSPILLLRALSAGCAAILVAVGWQQKRLIPQFASALINFLVNLWAIPRFGAAGAAIIYIISEIILLAGYAGGVLYYFKKRAA